MPIKPSENDEQITTQPQIEQTQTQVQPQIEQPTAAPVQPTAQQEVDDFYKDLFEEDDNTQGTQVNTNQTYKPEDLDFFKEMLDPDEFAYLLDKAAKLNNPAKVEELVENNPEQAEAVIADNTPLDVEAKQSIDGGKDAEVKNEAVENFIEEHNNPNTPDPLVGDIKKGILGERSSIESNPTEQKEYKEDAKSDPLNGGIDWDKVHIYEPGEDPIEWMNKDDYDPRVEENLNYDYEEGVGAPGVLTEKDEDFAGPDELPAQIYDNSDFQPKQLPAVINDGLPSEQYYEPVYDTSDYNFDWYYEDITPEQIDKQVDEDESIPEEEKEEEKEKRKKLLPKLKGRNLTASGSGHSVSSSPKQSYDKANGSMSFGSGKGIMSSASIGNFMANPKWDKPKQEPIKEVRSEASKAPEPVETVAKSSPIGVKSNPTTSNRTSNGGFNSGGVNKTGNSLIKVNKVSLPSGEANNQPDNFGGSLGTTNNLRDSRIQLLEARIKELDPELQEHFGFSTKHKHVEYKDTPIDECSGGQLREIEEILEACGV